MNLSVARLLDRHVNAVRLIEELGSEQQKCLTRDVVTYGAFLDV